MNKLKMLSFFICLSCMNFTTLEAMAQDTDINNQRQLLQQYFLYISLKKSYGEDCFENDFSASYYVDVANYGLIAFQKLDSLSEVFIQNKPLNGDKSKYETVFLDCMERFNSDEIRMFIISLDKYMIKD